MNYERSLPNPRRIETGVGGLFDYSVSPVQSFEIWSSTGLLLDNSLTLHAAKYQYTHHGICLVGAATFKILRKDLKNLKSGQSHYLIEVT